MNRNLIFAVCLFCLFCLTFAAPISQAGEPKPGPEPGVVPDSESGSVPGSESGSEPDSEPEPTLFLEFFWLNDSIPREALLMAPPKKVPLVIVRVLSKDEKLESLAAARGTLTQSTENPDDLLLACSEPRTIWGKAGAEKAVPPNFLITSKYLGAVDLGETLTACLVKPVPPEKEEEIVRKYLPPEKN